jgi:membrane-anchored mycosin MYCP
VQLVSTGPIGPGRESSGGAWAASAFVAAAAALVRSYYPQLTARQVIHRLEATADQPGIAVPDWQVGYGMVDPYAAVAAVLPEEWGAGAPAADLPSPRLPPRRRTSAWPVTAALGVLGASVLLVTIVAVGVWVIGHGRRRRWEPPTWPVTAAPAAKPAKNTPAGEGPAARQK